MQSHVSQSLAKKKNLQSEVNYTRLTKLILRYAKFDSYDWMLLFHSLQTDLHIIVTHGMRLFLPSVSSCYFFPTNM